MDGPCDACDAATAAAVVVVVVVVMIAAAVVADAAVFVVGCRVLSFEVAGLRCRAGAGTESQSWSSDIGGKRGRGRQRL